MRGRPSAPPFLLALLPTVPARPALALLSSLCSDPSLNLFSLSILARPAPASIVRFRPSFLFAFRSSYTFDRLRLARHIAVRLATPLPRAYAAHRRRATMVPSSALPCPPPRMLPSPSPSPFSNPAAAPSSPSPPLHPCTGFDRRFCSACSPGHVLTVPQSHSTSDAGPLLSSH